MLDLSSLNEQQKQAVLNTYHMNTSLVAGAGSGKTTVIKYRTAYMIKERQVDPKSIMIVTFTNKAAKEIKERIGQETNFADDMWLGTFHSICVKILRQFGHSLKLNRFTIMDDKDAQSVLTECAKHIDPYIEPDQIKEIRGKISHLKSELQAPQTLLNHKNRTSSDILLANIYHAYQTHNINAKTLDFDDLILYTVILLTKDEHVRQWFHEHVPYIVVNSSAVLHGNV